MTTFADNVFAREQGASAECYEFTFSNGTSLYFTSFERDLDDDETPDEIAYVHIPIQREEFEVDNALTANRLKVTAPQLNTFANSIIQNGQISLKITKIFLSDKTFQVLFDGLILSIEKSLGEATATCVSKMFYLEKELPRVFFQSSCNNTLFDSFCSDSAGPKYADFLTPCPGTLSNNIYGKSTIFIMNSLITTVHGVTIPLGDVEGVKGFWQYGQCIYGGEYRSITAHNPGGALTGVTGSDLDLWGVLYSTVRSPGESDDDYRARLVVIGKKVLLLHYPFSGNPTGSKTVDLVPGCDKTGAYCKDIFNNIINFIGFPYFPASDPTVMPIAE